MIINDSNVSSAVGLLNIACRNSQILELCISGLSTEEIAETLNISYNAVLGVIQTAGTLNRSILQCNYQFYGLYHDSTPLRIYIGRTMHSSVSRLHNHIATARQRQPAHSGIKHFRWINELLNAGHIPSVRVLSEFVCNRHEADVIEQLYMKHYMNLCYELLNTNTNTVMLNKSYREKYSIGPRRYLQLVLHVRRSMNGRIST